MPNNPNTASPVRSAEVETALNGLRLTTGEKPIGYMVGTNDGPALLAYIAQLESSQPAVTSGAVEVAAQVLTALGLNDVYDSKQKVAAIIQTAMDGAAKDTKDLWKGIADGKQCVIEQLEATQPPAADGKLREALEEVRRMGREGGYTIRQLAMVAERALAQPASGGAE